MDKLGGPAFLPSHLTTPALMVLASTAEAARNSSPSHRSLSDFPSIYSTASSHLIESSVMHRLGSSAFQGRSPHLALYHPQGGAEHYERAHEYNPHFFPLHSQFSQGGMPLGSILHNKTSGPSPLFNGTGAFRRIGPHDHSFSPFHPLHQQARSLSPREREREQEYKNSESSELRLNSDENHNERKSPRSEQNGEGLNHSDEQKYSLRYDDENKNQESGEKVHIKREPGQDDLCCGNSESELRIKRRRLSSDHVPCCPVCNITIRPGEIKSHFEWEIERLFQRDDGRNGKKREAALQARKSMSGLKMVKDEKPDVPNDDSPASTRHQTYLRVCANRMARSGSPVGQREDRPVEGAEAGPSGTRTANCPVCGLSISGSSDELNSHVESCLRKQKGEIGPEDEQEGRRDRFEEYEWAGQHRIRATALLEDGYRGMGFDAPKKEKEDEDGTDLNVDGDDSVEYGKAQFTESDVIPCSSDEPTDEVARQAIRGAVISGENSPIDKTNADRSRWQNSDGETEDNSVRKIPIKLPTIEEIEKNSDDPVVVISNLKSLVKEQDKQISSDRAKCLICMEHYASPLVSISCWHVHCEECWLRSLGAKKLCPQCNTITSPNDLRRIFL